MEETKRYPHEANDEAPLDNDLITILKGIGIFAVVMLVITFVGIWSKDFSKQSSFSTITGKVEKPAGATAPAPEKKP